MRVLFIEIDTERQWAVASLGPAFLAAYIRRVGHDASMVRIQEDAPVEELVEVVRKTQPDLIGISLTSRQWLGANRLLAGLREAMDIPVIAGGLHPTFAPEETIHHPGIDYVCLGEGERAFLYLVEALDAGVTITNGMIDNIWITGGTRPKLGPPFEPIDELPYMARDLLDEQYGVVNMTTQRGCPFACTYCAARMYDELYEGNGTYGRRRSHASVLAELDAIRAAGELNYVIFLDDTFTIHHPWVYEFCQIYGERGGVPFSIHARVETVNEKMINRLAEAGCRHITYGVESGSERVRREIMKRPVTNHKIINVFRWTREAGILVTANYMMGVPGETRAEMQQTIDLHHELDPGDFGYFVFYPYPGTHLFQECRRLGYLPENYLELPANHRESILDLPEMTKEDITCMYDRWTQIRIRHQLKRIGSENAPKHRDLITTEIEQCAAAG